jgi:excisionase family DNA binding protein
LVDVLGERYLSTREFAELLNVSRVAVIKWIKSGRTTAYEVHGKWRIPYSEVEKRVKRVAIYTSFASRIYGERSRRYREW